MNMRHIRLSHLVLLLALPLAASTVRIVQTNSAGDNVHLIDPGTNKVVGIFDGIEANHAAAGAPDGTSYYISNESDSSLNIVDGKTTKVSKTIRLTAGR